MPNAALVSEIRRELDTIGDPCSVAHGTPMGLDEMGLVEAVHIDAEGNVRICLRLTSPTCVMVGYFGVQARSRIGRLPGVRSVEVTADHGLDWTPGHMSEGAQARRRALLHSRGIPMPAN
jgi:metal-sulfur cluster biosynthetic enzyme